MVDDEDADKELKRLQLAKARREAAEQERKDRLEVEAVHDEALAMRAREKDAEEQEKYGKSFRGRAKKFFSRRKDKNSGGGGDGRDFNEDNPRTGESRGSGGSTFSPKLLIQQHQSKLKWLVLFLVLAVAFFIYKFGWKEVSVFLLRYVVKIVFFLVYFGVLIWAFANDEKKSTAIVVVIPYIIWFIDSTTIFGPTYQGFRFDPLILIQTNWLAVLTSSMVSFLLVINIFREFFDRDWGFLLSIGAFAAINWASATFLPVTNTTNYPIVTYLPIFMVLLGIGLIFLFRRWGYSLHPESLSYMLMVLVFSFFWVNWSWASNAKAILHVAWIVMFCLFYIPSTSNVDKSRLYFFTSLALIIDFFGYSLKLDVNGYIFPIIVVMTSAYAYNFTKSKFAFVNGLSIVALFLFLWWTPATVYAEGFQFEEKLPENEQGVFQNFKSALDRLISGSEQVITERLDYATGGYSGLVEKNRYESLGVYFTNPRATEPKFFTEDEVSIWATIRSKTYQDPVVISFDCNRKTKDGKIRADVMVPPERENLLVFQLEENDVECTFNNIPEPGQHEVILTANYPFATNAYLKAYFIDRDSYRAYVRENIDPLTQFGIKDKNPIASFTNGPVEIGMHAPQYVFVGDTSTPPRLEITLKNRQAIEDKDKRIISRWEGKIVNIQELVILTPPGVTIPECTGKAIDGYDEAKCKESCNTFVTEQCTKTCKDENCKKQCDEMKSNCDSDCDSLFKVNPGEGQTNEKYKGYSLKIENEDDFKNIDSLYSRTFGCKIIADSTVLDKTPITTRYFRVRARYKYQLENTVRVSVEKRPGSFGTSEQYLNQIHTIDGVAIDPTYIRAIAIIESGTKHCKQGGEECEPKDVVASPDGSSVGFMQVNVRDPPYDKWKTDASDVCSDLPPKPEGSKYTVYDYKCNIELGVKILADKYKAYAGGKIYQYKCSKLEFKKEYSGWDAAIRGYNGWGCPKQDNSKCSKECLATKTCDKQCMGMLLYVDNVKDALYKIQNLGKEGSADATNERNKQFGDLFLSRAIDVIEPAKDDLTATYSKGVGITLRWPASPSSTKTDVAYYVEKNDKRIANIAETIYLDEDVVEGTEYTYEIIAHDDIKDSTASSIKVTPPTTAPANP